VIEDCWNPGAVDGRKELGMHRSAVGTAVLLCLALSALPALAHGPNQPPHQQYRIGDLPLESGEVIKERLGVAHVLAVVGPSMGGMQVLQRGVSHPDFMDSLVAMVPLARTPAWSVV
jgi:homoserine O-acetyltransferase